MLTSRQELQARWSGEEARIEKILSALKTGADWTAFLGAFEANGVAYGPLPLLDILQTDGRDLRGFPLENVDLSGIQLDGVDLEFAVFFKVTLNEAIISSQKKVSNLAGASFVHCRFEHAQFESANCKNVHFGHCNLSNANFSGATLDGASLRASNLDGANFVRAALRDVDFIHSELRNVSVSAETALGVISPAGSSPLRIRLEDQAVTMNFDRFQFANQGEAFQEAAKVYAQFADAWNSCGFVETGNLWRSKAKECLLLASGHRHG